MTISRTRVIAILFGAAATTWGAGAAFAQDTQDTGQCAGLPSQGALKNALTLARNQANGGFNLDMWATVVNRDGLVCAVAFTGSDRGQQWPGSRVISAQKANTANAFSLPGLALSTANLYSAVQPGGSLYGLQPRRDSACWEPACHEPLSGTSVSKIAERGLRVSADPLRSAARRARSVQVASRRSLLTGSAGGSENLFRSNQSVE